MKKNNHLLIHPILVLMLFLSGCSGLTVGINGFNPANNTETNNKIIETILNPASENTPVPLALPETITGLQSALVSVYEEVNPSVVNITVMQKQSASTKPKNPFENLPDIPGFKFDFPQPEGPQDFSTNSIGSGFVWDKEGHIVTNQHVVDGASRIIINFSDGTSTEGKLVGSDRDSDLAVVKINLPASQLKPVQLADSSLIKVGQIAIALGNPFGLEGTMTYGIISALGRSLPVQAENLMGPSYSIPDVIQTDAPINPGNSGGVLVDIQGRVIGVTSAIESPIRANAGIGFAIPSAIVKKVVPSLIKTGSFEHSWIGISGTSLNLDYNKAMNLSQNQKGALVLEVTPGSPAEKAGLRGSDRQVEIDNQKALVGGDIIIAIDDQPIKEFDDIVAFLARYTEVGQTIKIKVLRQGKEEVLPLTLAARPKDKSTPPVVEETNRSSDVWLGIEGRTLTPEIIKAMELADDQQGVLVGQVEQGSPADKAGLQGSYKPLNLDGERILIGGDIIIAFNNKPVHSIEDLKSMLSQHKAGDVITLKILRRSGEIDLKVKLEKRP